MTGTALLERITALFHEQFLWPVIATEIEFYLHGASSATALEAFTLALQEEAAKQGLSPFTLQKERGTEQYEVALPHRRDPVSAELECRNLVASITRIAANHGLKADFSAKPVADQPGSGLHVHFHLEDEHGVNLFTRQEEEYSAKLLHSVAGILAAMKESMPFFAPNAGSYARFSPGSNAPTTISWGPNNRTVAVRLPTKPLSDKHLEHRVAGADADSALVISALLAAAHFGLRHALIAPEPIHGNASLPLYALEALPATAQEAMLCLMNGQILRHYMPEECERQIVMAEII